MVEKRIVGVIDTANEIVLDRAIRHAHFIERFKTHEVNKIIGLLNDNVLPDATAALERRMSKIATRGFDLSPTTTRRLKDVIDASSGVITAGLRDLGHTLRTDLDAFAISEAEWQTKILNSATGDFITVDFTTPPPNKLRSIVTKRPMTGRLLRDWWAGVDVLGRTEITRQINIGMAQGEGIPQMVRRLVGTNAAAFRDGAYNSIRRNATSIVRTATNHVSTQAREMVYEQNDTMIKSVQYVATLDSRTSDICISLDGQLFPINEGPRPPMHHQCRSTTIPIIKSWKELGISLKEAPPGTRAALGGNVPAQTTYGQWIKGQDVKIQNDALGPTRARLMREGKVDVTKFVDSKHRPLDLKQIRKKWDLEPSDIKVVRTNPK